MTDDDFKGHHHTENCAWFECRIAREAEARGFANGIEAAIALCRDPLNPPDLADLRAIAPDPSMLVVDRNYLAAALAAVMLGHTDEAHAILDAMLEVKP